MSGNFIWIISFVTKKQAWMGGGGVTRKEVLIHNLTVFPNLLYCKEDYVEENWNDAYIKVYFYIKLYKFFSKGGIFSSKTF